MSSDRSPRLVCSTTTGTKLASTRSSISKLQPNSFRDIREDRMEMQPSGCAKGSPTPPEVIRREIVLPASPAEVWVALTDNKDVSRWFGAEVEMAPRLGGRVRFRWPDGVEREAVIEALETDRLLV